jgi:hypothetical protein
MKHFLMGLALLLCQLTLSGQDSSGTAKFSQDYKVKYDVVSLGLGIGIDHGGIGGSFTGYPIKQVGLFGGFGYALAGVGLVAGAKFRFISEQKFTKWAPFVEGMYGYNTAIAVTNAQEYNKLFYGPTFGAGVTFRFNPMKSGGLHLGLLIPLRGAEVDRYITELKSKGVEFPTELVPFAISIAYMMVLK